MAEFQEVMKQAKRLCSMYGPGCTGCPLANDKDMCILLGCRADGVLPEEFDLAMLAKAERIIMDWTKENPEPVYPSWKEAWRQAFPNGGLVPCPMHFDARCKPDDCSSCSACKERPIPADIAEKLGIKPIGGLTDEKA